MKIKSLLVKTAKIFGRFLLSIVFGPILFLFLLLVFALIAVALVAGFVVMMYEYIAYGNLKIEKTINFELGEHKDEKDNTDDGIIFDAGNNGL